MLSGGWVSGYGMMLCFGSFPLLVPSSRPFHFVLESFLLFVLLCLVAHIRDPKADTIINKGQWAKNKRTGVLQSPFIAVRKAGFLFRGRARGSRHDVRVKYEVVASSRAE